MAAAAQRERLSTKALVTQVLVEAASETTAHGLSKLAGQRPLYVKLCWLLAFLGLLSVFTFSTYGFTSKLVGGEVSTSYEAEAVKFQFPDVYFCNNVQVSGTYSVTLPSAVVADINAKMSATSAVFDSGLQRLLNSSFAGATAAQIDQMKLYRLKSAIQSMPYSLLVDQLAHKEQQSVLKNDSKSGVSLRPFYHPNHLKCLKVELTELRRAELSKVNSEISFQFILDPHFSAFTYPLNISKYSQVQNVTVPLYNNLTVFVYDWDLDMPFEIDRPMGMRLYLAPRGEYPSRFVTNFLLAPGRSYSIGLTMQNVKKEPEAFDGQCLTEAPDVQFVNPYDGSAYPFSYSNSFCYFSEFARQLSQKGCSPYVNPLPWEFRHLRFCLNVTGLNESRVQSNLLQAYTADTAALSDYQQLCQSRQLCLNRWYETSTSSANWPNENGQIRLIVNIMKAVFDRDPHTARPAWQAIYVNIMNSLFDKDEGLPDAEQEVGKFFSISGLKVTLRSKESRSSQIHLSPGYSLATYIADMGGTAGIYIGCSLLSLCELIELFYNLIARTRRQRGSGNVVQVRPLSPTVGSETSDCSDVEKAGKRESAKPDKVQI